MSHDERHLDVMARWLAGDELTPQEEGTLQGCEQCRVEWSELGALTRDLDRWGFHEQERALAGVEPPVWEERALGRLRRAMDAEGGAPRGRRARLVVFTAATAAAAVLLLVALWPSGDGGGADAELWLHANNPMDMVPSGTVSEISEFHWKRELPDLGTFRIRLLRAGDLRAFHTAQTTVPRWVPDPSIQLPEHFFWEVEVLDGLGTSVDVGRAEVHLR